MRTDSAEKIAATARYGADVVLPGMLYGKVVRSPIAHGRIRAFDTDAARRVPGVRAVVTGFDVPRVLWGYGVKDQSLLAWEKVRFVGDPVAAVAATSVEAAEEAARKIHVDYEALPAVFTPEEALRANAPLVHEGLSAYAGVPGNAAGNCLCSTAIRRGDVGAAFATAHLVVEDTFEGHVAHPMQLEPHASVARFTAEGTLEIWTSTQVPFAVRRQVAEVLRLPQERVRIIATQVGGAFGNKLIMSVEAIGALLSQAAGAPVRIVMTREEEFLATITRHAIRTELRTAVDREGTIQARYARLVLDKGAYADHGLGGASLSTLLAVGPYRIAHLDVEAVCVYTNKVPAGAYRGPCGPQVTFAVESHMDNLAERLGVDPIDFRLRNALGSGDVSATGQKLRSVGLRETLERIRQVSGWDERRGVRERDGARVRGIGIACGWWLTGGGPSNARLELDPDGRVRVWSGIEIGTGAISDGVAMVVAERLGVPLSRVEVMLPDTAASPYEPGSMGSRTLFTAGSAASIACDQLLSLIRMEAAALWGVSAEQVEVARGQVRNRLSGAPMDFAELARRAQAGGRRMAGEGMFFVEPDPPSGAVLESHLYPAWLAPSFFTSAAEVEVDTETGRVRPLRVVHAQDVGRAINPPGIHGQICGGVVQALGYALTEEMVIKDGKVLNADLLDYRIPTIVDVPPIEGIIVETPSDEGRLGTKGAGEAPVVCVAAAVANAFAHATGVRPRRLPLSPENAFWTLQDAANREPSAGAASQRGGTSVGA